MRIAILNLSAGGLSGGYQKYLDSLLPLLQGHPSVSETISYVPKGYLCNSFNIKYFEPWESFLGFPSIRRDLKKFKPDIIFVPTARYFGFKNIPLVNMVRNMEPLSAPYFGNPLHERVKNFFRARLSKYSIKRSSKTIAVSYHVKKWLIDSWGIPPEKLDVIYHGVGNLYDGTLTPPSRPEVIPIHTPFIFTAGSIRPARGLEDLIDSLPKIMRVRPNIKLVIAGNIDQGMDFYWEQIRAKVKSFGCDGNIIWAPHLTSAEMNWSFINAEAFIMTSRAEACPNIVLEALENGALSVSTDVEPMPEFFGSSAIYYQQGVPDSLFNSLVSLLSKSDHDRVEMRKKAIELSTKYSWELCALKTIEVLKKAHLHI